MKKLFVDRSRPKRRAIARRIGHGKKIVIKNSFDIEIFLIEKYIQIKYLMNEIFLIEKIYKSKYDIYNKYM